MSETRGGGLAYSTQELMQQAMMLKASDIHLSPGRPPLVRVNGELAPLDGIDPLTPDDTMTLAKKSLSEEHWKQFLETRELDLSVSEPGVGRFRINLHWQRGSVAIALRSIAHNIPGFEELGLPRVVQDIAKREHGLFIVSGPTGSGKTTTLASILDYINTHRSSHIVTIEDPIEYLHRHKRSLVTQREIHSDTLSFGEALRHVLRQDPDVILIGEIRDLDTMQIALTAAETGHLVFATLHTQDCPQSIDRIIDVFPPHQQEQIRVQIGATLEGVVAQQLLPKVGSKGRVAACEVLMPTPAVRNLIREGKTHQLYTVMQTGSQQGMQTMNASLAEHIKAGRISKDNALRRTGDPEELERLLMSGVG